MALERQLADLERLAERARNVLLDPRKQKWHEDNRLQLMEIEAEIARLKSRDAPRAAKSEPVVSGPHSSR